MLTLKFNIIGTILNIIKPSVLTVNETFFENNRKLNLQGFLSFTLNRKYESGGGISSSINECDRLNTLKVYEGNKGHEILITRHSQFIIPINVINVYGVVESRNTNDKLNDCWEEVFNQIKKVEAKGELLVIIGDFNVHVGDIIYGNNVKRSHGGKLIKEFIDNSNYILLNSSDKAVNGPFTRVDPGNDNKKSVLDLCIVSKELEPYVECMLIDNNRNFTPYRSISRNQIRLRIIIHYWSHSKISLWLVTQNKNNLIKASNGILTAQVGGRITKK